jgi:hypothetical protein
MSSEAQIAANRLNAQKSTGPNPPLSLCASVAKNNPNFPRTDPICNPI